MRGASFHLKPVLDPAASEIHNKRRWDTEHPAPRYLLPEGTGAGFWRARNSGSVPMVHAEKMAAATGKARAMAEAGKYSPIWEGVLNLSEGRTRSAYDSQIATFVEGYQKITGHRVLTVDAHLDEGRIDPATGDTRLNPHAHVVIDRTDERGRPIRLTKEQLRQVQDLAAEATGLVRGEDAATTRRRHLPHQAYRALARAGRVKSLDDIERETAELERQRQQAVEEVALADLYGKLRGLMKATGQARQADYSEARQQAEAKNRAWIEARVAELEAAAARDPARRWTDTDLRAAVAQAMPPALVPRIEAPPLPEPDRKSYPQFVDRPGTLFSRPGRVAIDTGPIYGEGWNGGAAATWKVAAPLLSTFAHAAEQERARADRLRVEMEALRAAQPRTELEVLQAEARGRRSERAKAVAAAEKAKAAEEGARAKPPPPPPPDVQEAVRAAVAPLKDQLAKALAVAAAEKAKAAEEGARAKPPPPPPPDVQEAVRAAVAPLKDQLAKALAEAATLRALPPREVERVVEKRIEVVRGVDPDDLATVMAGLHAAGQRPDPDPNQWTREAVAANARWWRDRASPMNWQRGREL